MFTGTLILRDRRRRDTVRDPAACERPLHPGWPRDRALERLGSKSDAEILAAFTAFAPGHHNSSELGVRSTCVELNRGRNTRSEAQASSKTFQTQRIRWIRGAKPWKK